MQLSPYISHQFNGMIWRMEIDPVTSTLFAEIRNEEEKQVSFASVNLSSGQINFDHLIIQERWLTGMEAAYNGVLLLHGYQSDGSPTHKSIIAINGESGETLWDNYNLTFSHICAKGIVCFDARIQARKLFLVDVVTGESLGNYNPVVDEDIDSGITLPDMVPVNLISNEYLPEEPFGNIVHKLDYNNYRIVSLHPLKDEQLSQRLYIFNDGLQVFTDLLNSAIQKLQPEAFVLHNQHLIYLKNRTELNVINLKN